MGRFGCDLGTEDVYLDEVGRITKERDAALAQVERMWPVVEAAVQLSGKNESDVLVLRELFAAVETYKETLND
jgi:hypothetical protein